MKIQLNNIGILKEVNIDILGITVIAGKNSTGKSTVSKSLFSMFRSYYNIYNRIESDKKASVFRLIRGTFIDIDSKTHEPMNSIFRRYNQITSSVIHDIWEELEKGITSQKTIESILLKHLDFDSDIVNIRLLSERIIQLIQQPNETILDYILEKQFRNEFNDQINNVFSEEKAIVKLIVKDRTLSVEVRNNTVRSTGSFLNLLTDIVYIDDASLNVDSSFYSSYWDLRNDHNGHLLEQIDKSKNEKENYVIKAGINQRLSNIINRIDDVFGNYLINESEEINGKGYLNVVNLSSGTKTLYLIKKLLESGIISENGTLILDEPEVHLHPEWQLKLSEIIVLLQQEFGLHILLTTHSPYMLNGIEVYSKVHKNSENCRYYLAETKNGFAEIKDVTMDTGKIYDLLTYPLMLLDKIEEGLDD